MKSLDISVDVTRWEPQPQLIGHRKDGRPIYLCAGGAVQNTSGKAMTLFVSGVVGIGMITALFLPGRQTVQGIKAAGQAGSGILGTAIRG